MKFNKLIIEIFNSIDRASIIKIKDEKQFDGTIHREYEIFFKNENLPSFVIKFKIFTFFPLGRFEETKPFNGKCPRILTMDFFEVDQRDKEEHANITGKLKEKAIYLFSLLINLLKKEAENEKVNYVIIFCRKDQPSRIKLYNHLINKFGIRVNQEQKQGILGMIHRPDIENLEYFVAKTNI